MRKFTVNRNDAGLRLDKFIKKVLKFAPDSLIYKYLRKKRIKVNGKKEEISYKLTEGDVLEYVLIRSEGPDHRKTFEVEVRVNSNPCGRGVGTSKRKAEQAAAKAALKVFGIC